MTDEEITACAAALVGARRSGRRLEALPVTPSSVIDAHAIQDHVAAQLGEAIGGFKANAAPGSRSTRGLIYARAIHRSPASLSPTEVPHLGVEGEVAFRFTRDLPARDEAYTRDEVADAVAAMPAIEIVSGRFIEPRARPPLEQLADNMINGALVHGAEIIDWSHLDMSRIQVALRVNGEPVLERQGGHPIEDPLYVAAALVNMMREADGVKSGQIVTTGSWTGLRFLKPGQSCAVHFEKLGEVEVVIED